MNKTSNLKKIGNFSYVLSAAFMIVALLINVLPPSVVFAVGGGNPGAIWTTGSTCVTPDPQDDNAYFTYETVYIRGNGFPANTALTWEITQVSGPDKTLIASGVGMTNADGYFCVTAHTIQPGEDGEFTVDVVVGTGNKKNDNYGVTEVLYSLNIVKTGALQLGGNGMLDIGDAITYTLDVTNTGDGTLTNVLVSDPLLGTILCPGGNPIPSIAPGATVSCYGSYYITLADLLLGYRDNTATADSPQTPPDTDDWRETFPITGCTDPTADNYDPTAELDDGSCYWLGCTDQTADNYDPTATVDDGSCYWLGCTDQTADNYDPTATVDDGSCYWNGCTDPTADNYDPQATVDDGSCYWSGCTDPTANNYDPQATVDDGSCTYNEGCTDRTADNYDPTAVVDDGSCYWLGCTDQTADNYDPTATVDDGSCYWLGCTDQTADNYDPTATQDDGSCYWSGCTDPSADNYDPQATVDDGSCYWSGCTDPTADNYDPQATVEDGSCYWSGCTDPTANNYDPTATVDDGSCTYDEGCTDPTADNYDPTAVVDDGSCYWEGCTDPTANNYDPTATVDDGSCTYDEYGCMDPTADNYDPNATIDDGSCAWYGCTDPLANNYDPTATVDDGSCTYNPPPEEAVLVERTCTGFTLTNPNDFAIEGTWSIVGTDLSGSFSLGAFGTETINTGYQSEPLEIVQGQITFRVPPATGCGGTIIIIPVTGTTTGATKAVSPAFLLAGVGVLGLGLTGLKIARKNKK